MVMIDRIKALIEYEASLSRDWGKQARFARKIGVSEGNVGDWLKGKSSPNEETQRRICAEYGISSRWLASGQGDMFETRPEQTQPGEPQKAEATPQMVPVKGHITAQELFEMGKIAGRLEKLEEEHDKLERRHNKLLEGVSRAVSDYAGMYGPIVGKNKKENDAPSDPPARPRPDDDADVSSHTG